MEDPVNLAQIIDGPVGKKLFTPGEILDMSPTNQATLTAGIQAAINANPRLDVKITDTLGGGLKIEWSTK
jgi:hypothetical protein